MSHQEIDECLNLLHKAEDNGITSLVSEEVSLLVSNIKTIEEEYYKELWND